MDTKNKKQIEVQVRQWMPLSVFKMIEHVKALNPELRAQVKKIANGSGLKSEQVQVQIRAFGDSRQEVNQAFHGLYIKAILESLKS